MDKLMVNTREHRYAVMEAELNESERLFFAARPLIDTDNNRTLFRNGFRRGWEMREVTPADAVNAEGDRS